MFTTIVVASTLFVSTNIDDIFVLVGFFADPKFRVPDIVLGQYAGIVVLFSVSLAASLLSLVVPRPYLGLMGLIPIVLGVKKMLEYLRGRYVSEAEQEQHPDARVYGRGVTVALVTVANGGDNIGTYAPAFAIRSRYQIAEIALVFAILTAAWCFLAHWLVNHPTLGAPIRRYGHRLTPIMLMAIGLLVLHEAGTLNLLFSSK